MKKSHLNFLGIILVLAVTAVSNLGLAATASPDQKIACDNPNADERFLQSSCCDPIFYGSFRGSPANCPDAGTTPQTGTQLPLQPFPRQLSPLSTTPQVTIPTAPTAPLPTFQPLPLPTGVIPGQLLGQSVEVNSIEDDITVGDGNCTLREAIIAIHLGGTDCRVPQGVTAINLPAGIYVLKSGPPDTSNAPQLINSGDLDINANITINGAGPGNTFVGVLRSQLEDRIFDVHGGSLTLRNITFTGGKSEEFGGAILVRDGSLTVENSQFVNNEAKFGGAISSGIPAEIIVNSTTFFKNKAESGGAISAFGKTSITNSTFSENRATGQGATIGGGGAISINGSSLTLNNNTITRNTAQRQDAGGGLMVNSQQRIPPQPGGGLPPAIPSNVSISNTILAGNANNDCGMSGQNQVNSRGFNVLGVIGACGILTQPNNDKGSAGFEALKLGSELFTASDGLTPPVYIPQIGSPVLDQGNDGVPGSTPTACLSKDEVGNQRTQGRCDIGAVEGGINLGSFGPLRLNPLFTDRLAGVFGTPDVVGPGADGNIIPGTTSTPGVGTGTSPTPPQDQPTGPSPSGGGAVGLKGGCALGLGSDVSSSAFWGLWMSAIAWGLSRRFFRAR